MIVVVGSHGHGTVEFGKNGSWTSRTSSSSVVAHARPFGVPLAGNSAPCVVLGICLDVISLAGPAQSRKPSMSRSETEIVLLSGFCVEIIMLISSERASLPRSSIWERAEVPSPDAHQSPPSQSSLTASASTGPAGVRIAEVSLSSVRLCGSSGDVAGSSCASPKTG